MIIPEHYNIPRLEIQLLNLCAQTYASLFHETVNETLQK
jgi:hypothetical protein